MLRIRTKFIVKKLHGLNSTIRNGAKFGEGIVALLKQPHLFMFKVIKLSLCSIKVFDILVKLKCSYFWGGQVEVAAAALVALEVGGIGIFFVFILEALIGLWMVEVDVLDLLIMLSARTYELQSFKYRYSSLGLLMSIDHPFLWFKRSSFEML